MHQKVVIWKDDCAVEDVEADQSYVLAEVDNITRKTFEKIWQKLCHALLLKMVVITK